MTAVQKRLTLSAAILGSVVAFVDGTVVNVALPRIRDDLGGGLAGQQRISDAYLLTRREPAVRGGANDRRADRLPRRAGGGRRAARPQHAGAAHRALRARRAR